MFNCAQVDNQLQARAAPERSGFTRYAIYYTPQPGSALAAFGRSWFGRANDGATLQAFSTSGLSGTATPFAAPGRYSGLHALFRAPFALREGVTMADLRTRLIAFATHCKPVETGPLTLARAGRYLVLRTVNPMRALDWLATQCLSTFEDVIATPENEDDEDYIGKNSIAESYLNAIGSKKVPNFNSTSDKK